MERSSSLKAQPNEWQQAFSQPAFIFLLVFASCTLVLLFSFLPHFFHFIQGRQGITINDPFLSQLPNAPFNLSYIILPLTYLPAFLSVGWIARYPYLFLRGLIAYNLLLATRFVCLYLTPFEPPTGMVILHDVLAYGHHIITKDLFFSGHTASLVLCFLLVKNKSLRIFLACVITLLVALLLLQKIHYTIDFVIAPFISYGCYQLAELIMEQFKRFGLTP